METIKWSGREWLTRETWGLYHPNNKLFWYDRSAVEVNGGGLLKLKVHKNPRQFDGSFIETGVGLISSVDDFRFGHFEIECMLPTGKHLWPAFWSYGRETWPPEVDIFEGYTKAGGNYFGTFFDALSLWNVQTNAHWGNVNKGTKGSASPKTHWFGIRNPSRNYIRYRMSWFPDKIIIYYNNNEVRRFSEKPLLEQMNSQPSRVIINNAVTASNWSLKDDFKVRYFRYEPL
ncbi:MAG: glycoside hydrolase family 16 protein [Bacteroidales bacterium]|nr:glycoside hydrolase family 16 protein [Bacteroidales bacterium]